MRTVQIDLSPERLHDEAALRRAAGAAEGEICRVVRRSIDCRRRNIVYHLTVEIDGSGEWRVASPPAPLPRERGAVTCDSHGIPLPSPLGEGSGVRPFSVIIVGAGPAGLFAALRAIELGIKPVIVERGKPVEQRRRDIARIPREQAVDPDSNWCFGEGGAGTFSDGKLYTRSTKRGDVGDVLRRFVQHGADPNIMVDVHAHIGTDRLGGIIANMRHTIEAAGGEYHFGCRVTDLIVRDGRVLGVHTADGKELRGDAVILATGHSARDIYHLFDNKGWRLEAKPFAIGVRVEHPQELINQIQYHGAGYSKLLPAATYSLTTQAAGHGVFSFCMCPGGVIVPAATAPGEQVVNGMSNSHRNSPWSNSGIAVTVNEECGMRNEELAVAHYNSSFLIPHSSLKNNSSFLTPHSSLRLLAFQQSVERAAFEAAGNRVAAPAQRLTDFLRRRTSSSLPRSGYLGDTVSHPLHELLPDFVVNSLSLAFKDFDRKMHGFVTNDALLLAVESRTSSPVRIPRNKETLQHVELQGLYPCGEGAGYAGGIVSSAIDGIRCIEAFAATI